MAGRKKTSRRISLLEASYTLWDKICIHDGVNGIFLDNRPKFKGKLVVQVSRGFPIKKVPKTHRGYSVIVQFSGPYRFAGKRSLKIEKVLQSAQFKKALKNVQQKTAPLLKGVESSTRLGAEDLTLTVR